MDEAINECGYRVSKPTVERSGVVCCGRCGHRIKENNSFCKWCGQKIGGTEDGE